MNMAVQQLADLRGRLASMGAPLSDNRPQWPVLDEAAYHGLAGDIVKTIEPHTEADPVALLIQVLVAFGSIVGRGPHVAVEGDEHHPNLFAVLVGDTAKGRKGTSWSRIRQLFEYVNDPWSKDRIMTGLSSGEGLIWQVRDPICKTERDKRTKETDEVLVDAGVDDKRLLVLEDEFASTLRIMGREGNSLSGVIRRAWDRADLAAMTKNSPATATGAHVSVIGHVTSDELRRYLDRTECGNGFANRFLFVAAKRSKCLPEGGSLTADALRPLAQKVAQAIESARDIRCVEKSVEARAVWAQVYPSLSGGLPGLLGAVTSRAEAQVIRLALVYALQDQSPAIDTPHLMAALAVWQYAEASAQYVFGDALGDPVADEIYRALGRAGEDGLTRTDISGLFKRHRDSGSINRALSMLVDRGLVVSRRQTTNGRTAEIWTRA